MIPPNISSLRTAELHIDTRKKSFFNLADLTDEEWAILDVKICESILTLPLGEDDFVTIDVIRIIHDINPVISIFCINVIELRYKDSFIICRAGASLRDFGFKLRPETSSSCIETKN